MRVIDEARIREELERLCNLEECVLQHVRFEDLLTSVVLTFNSIWEEVAQGRPERLRSNLNEPYFIELKLSIVQHFLFHEGLAEWQLSIFNELDWGLNEVSQVRLAEARDAAPWTGELKGFHRLVVAWEKGTERRIDIAFQGLEVCRLSDRPDTITSL